MKIFELPSQRVYIEAERIAIGSGVTFGSNVDIRLRGAFSLGDRSHLGSDTSIRGNNVRIGADLFHSSGLRVGGGGRQHPEANLTIGDRCTIHNNFINVCENVSLGDDVGLSQDVAILTHGYWLSVLEGYPARFAPVCIGDGVIVGYRALIMMGVNVGKRAVIGAQSVVTKDVEAESICAGNPARMIRKIAAPPAADLPRMLDKIIGEYKKIAEYHGISPRIVVDFPIVTVNNCRFDVIALSYEGEEDRETDDFRDYVRKWGLRFYSNRPFQSVW